MKLDGAGGHAKVICEVAESCGDTVKLIVDDDPRVSDIFGIPVTANYDFDKNIPMVIAVGDSTVRKKIVDENDFHFTTAVHKSATVSPTAVIMEGTVIFAAAVINAHSEIGRHGIVNTAAVIEHDCILEDFVHISPNVTLAGGVKVGEGTHIGIDACVIPGVKIGKWCVIGAGTVVIKNIPDFCTVVGNPGRIIKTKIN